MIAIYVSRRRHRRHPPPNRLIANEVLMRGVAAGKKDHVTGINYI